MWSQKDFEQKKKRTFKITVKETAYYYYYTEAEDKEEALWKFLNDEAKCEHGETTRTEVEKIEPI